MTMTLVKHSYNSKLVPDPGLVLQTPLCIPKSFCPFSLFKGHPRPPNPPKEGLNQESQKWTSPKAIFISLQSGLPMDLINTPISRVGCPSVENPENQADQFWAFLPKIQIYCTKP